MEPHGLSRFVRVVGIACVWFSLIVLSASAHSVGMLIYPGYGSYTTSHSHYDTINYNCGAQYNEDLNTGLTENDLSSVTFNNFQVNAHDETGSVYAGPYWIMDRTNGNNDEQYMTIFNEQLVDGWNYSFSTNWTVGSATDYYPSDLFYTYDGADAYGSSQLCQFNDGGAYQPT